jgi:hypothetical protein
MLLRKRAIRLVARFACSCRAAAAWLAIVAGGAHAAPLTRLGECRDT